MNATPLVLFFTIFLFSSCSQSKKNFLVKVTKTEFYEFGDPAGYINVGGDTIIPIGKYLHCYTDSIKDFGIVMTQEKRLIGIDKNDNELFEVYWFDNGPDYISDGLFRIVKNHKIGYADEAGRIVIEPQYDCAFPFEDGFAKVSNNCTAVKEDEHTAWVSENWITIDKKGIMKKP